MLSRADGLRWVKLALPLLIVMAIGLSPRSYAADRGLNGSGATSPQSAASMIERAADELPWRTDLREQAGIAAVKAADNLTAIRELSRVKAAQGGLSLNGLLALGDAFSASGDQKSALGAWEEALGIPGKDHSQVFTRLEAAYRSGQDLASLEKMLNLHAKETPQDPAVAYQLGLVSAIANPDQAADALNRAVALDSTLSSSVHTIEAGLLLAAKSQDPSHQMLLVGRALGSAGEWEMARLAFLRALELNPQNAEALAFRGEALYHLGQDGQPDLQTAIRMQPGSVLIQGLQAMYWLRQGTPERALVYLHAAAAQEPENPVWQAELGEALAAMGDLADAAGYYQAAARLAKTDAGYWRLLAHFSLQYQYQLSEIGLPAVRQAVLLNEKDAVSLDLMGQIMVALSDVTSAQRFLERAIEASPSSPDAHLHLGMLLFQIGDSAGAKQQFLLASKLQPGSNAGQQAGRLLEQYYP